MPEIVRGQYTFSGAKAVDAAQYFDIVMSHNYDGDMTYLLFVKLYEGSIVKLDEGI